MESDDARDQRHRSSLRGVWRERVRRWHQSQHAGRRLRRRMAVTEWRESLGINGNGKDGPTAIANPATMRKVQVQVWCSGQTGVRPCLAHFWPADSKT